MTDDEKRELRYRARLAWNNWQDTPDARRELDEQERKALAANDAWDRVVAVMNASLRRVALSEPPSSGEAVTNNSEPSP